MDLAALETACRGHLDVLYAALAAHEREHGEPPASLPSLYPTYIADAAVFRCPADRSSTRSSPTKSENAAEHGGSQPVLRVSSYLHRLGTDTAPTGGRIVLSPGSLPAEATWRDVTRALEETFGNRTPILSCQHHDGATLNLTSLGEVYRAGQDWTLHPLAAGAVVERLKRDLQTADVDTISQRWAMAAVEAYFRRWIEMPLPPALRGSLLSLADGLSRRVIDLPAASRAAAHRLAARCYQAMGSLQAAVHAYEAALGEPGAAEDAAGRTLLNQMRYEVRAGRRRAGGPPLRVVESFLAAELATQRVPGMSVAVVHRGEVIFARGCGYANVELQVAATPLTVYQLASITKQFTAAAVLMLVEEERFALDDPITALLPDLPLPWASVTVRHLLTHTSGIKSITSLPDFRKRMREDCEPRELISRVAGLPLEFRPGDRFAYNNTGYHLLGLLIEQISQRKYGDFLRERIFEPLQMSATRLNDLRAVIPQRATGYTWAGNVLRHGEYASATQPYAAGALVSTVLDLAKWDAALYREHLLPRSRLEEMWTPYRLNGGTRVDYGYGFGIGRFRGHKLVSHGGGIDGFSTAIVRFKEAQMTTIVLANRENATASQLALKLAALYSPELKGRRGTSATARRKLRAALANVAASDEVADFYRAIGPLRSVRLIDEAIAGTAHKYWCYTTFGRRSQERTNGRAGRSRWVHTLSVAEGGTIQEVLVEPA